MRPVFTARHPRRSHPEFVHSFPRNTPVERALASRLSDRGSPRSAWSLPLKVFVSILLALHIAAITTAHLAASPSSEIEQRLSSFFKCYHYVINQRYGYRYYSRLDLSVSAEHRHPWGTPIVLLEMQFDGPGKEIRKES